jgi:hypothetical protein
VRGRTDPTPMGAPDRGNRDDSTTDTAHDVGGAD